MSETRSRASSITRETMLALRAREGDVAAAEALLRRYTTMARTLIMRTGCRPHEIDDIYQDAVVETLACLPSLRQPEMFSTWFGRIVVFVTRNHARREQMRRRLGFVEPAGGEMDLVSAEAQSPEQVLEARQMSQPIGKLPTKVQQAVRMRHLEGEKISAIATRLGISNATVKRYLSDAETSVRQRLALELIKVGETLPERRPRRRTHAAMFAPLCWWRRRSPAPSRSSVRPRRAEILFALATAAATVAVSLSHGGTGAATLMSMQQRPLAAASAAPATFAAEPAVSRQAVAVKDDFVVRTATARPADSFVEAAGVNVRTGEDPQPLSLLRARLEQLGVRHVWDTDQGRLDWLSSLHAAGIGVSLAMGRHTDARALLATRAPFVEAVTLMHGHRGEAPEAWGRDYREHVVRTRRALSEDPATRHIPLVGISLANDALRAAVGDLSGLVDFAGGGAPSGRLPPGGAFMDGTLLAYRGVYGALPAIVPQVSHTTAACPDGLDETMHAKYVLRTFFETHKRGIVRTHGAFLFDNKAAPTRYVHGMGLLRSDGTPKLAYGALERTIALFADRGAAPAPGTLSFDLAAEQPDEISHALYQKRDGTWLLALWLDGASGPDDRTARVRVRLPDASYARRAHALVSGETTRLLPATTADGTAGFFEVLVTDGVVVVEASAPALSAALR